MWRQGDIYIQQAAQVPGDARLLPHLTLAEGEMTGHSHRIADAQSAKLYRAGASLFLRVTAAEATLIHQEHGPITLAAGVYRVWQQREYSPEEIRTVRD